MAKATTDNLTFNTQRAAPLRLADTVSDEIAAALFDGRIAPGDALPSEGEIARQFEVSKPIAREALRLLAGAGLIHTQQGKVARAKAMTGEPLDRIYGYAVRSSLKRLQEANEMRLVLESGIAGLAARRRAKNGLTVMQKAVEKMRTSIGQPEDFTEADIDFHHGMALATGNTMIRIQVEGMRSVQREVSELFSRRSNRTTADWKATVLRHQAIYDAISAGDESAAQKALAEHYDAANIASFEVANG
uniref:FadR/GntR family transcriptional regulator n=1 Tax=Pararhizobium sp. IMCC3301 TaxID=3067904 RepID=UPI002740E2A8|nr:FCD domain-containing protein [Pararhizobium sp. IMCC3301]